MPEVEALLPLGGQLEGTAWGWLEVNRARKHDFMNKLRTAEYDDMSGKDQHWAQAQA